MGEPHRAHLIDAAVYFLSEKLDYMIKPMSTDHVVEEAFLMKVIFSADS